MQLSSQSSPHGLIEFPDVAVSLALAEGACIFGQVLGFLGAPATVVMPFFFVTQLLMIIGFPTKERIDAFQS